MGEWDCNLDFTITVDAENRIIEVIYPANPNATQVEAYLSRIREVMGAQPKPWRCLIDQRAIKVLPEELANHSRDVYAFASEHGMDRAARVVAGALGSLQAGRVVREAALADKISIFTDREQALAWLRQEPAPAQ